MQTIQQADEALLGWHFLRDGKTRDGIPVEVGQTLRVEGHLELCERGLHGSLVLGHALKYAPGFTVCRVRFGGEILHDTDKLCATERTVVVMADARSTLIGWAGWCAAGALLGVRKVDQRSIDAVLMCLRIGAGDDVPAGERRKTRTAADAAAYAAYAAAAYVACAAADAAAAAADAAAYAAAYARSQARALMDAELERRIRELLGLEVR